MFNAVLVQATHEGEMLTTALYSAGETQPQHPLVLECMEAARQFLADANALARLTENVLLFGPLGGDRSGDRW
jgi:hypothetical protein